MVQAAFASDSNVVDVPLELNLDISSSDIDYNSNRDHGINSGKCSGSAKNSGRRSKGLYAAVDVARSKKSAARDVDADLTLQQPQASRESADVTTDATPSDL